MMAETASMLADCCYWTASFSKAGAENNARYYQDARFWYETAYYLIDYTGTCSLWDHMSSIESALGDTEENEVYGEASKCIGESIIGYLLENGLLPACKIELRMNRIKEDDCNHRAILYLKKADRIYGMQLEGPQGFDAPDPSSSDVMAYELCRLILDMQDEGADLWPGLVHRTILSMLLRYPKLDYTKMDGELIYRIDKDRYEELRSLMLIGLKNSGLLDRKSQEEILKAFACAVRKLHSIPDTPKLSIY